MFSWGGGGEALSSTTRNHSSSQLHKGVNQNRGPPTPNMERTSIRSGRIPYAAGKNSGSLESLISAPLFPILDLLQSDHHINSIYSDSRKLEWVR